MAECERLAALQYLDTRWISHYGAAHVEQFGTVMLDTRYRQLRASMLFIGSLDATVVHPCEMFREEAGASSATIVSFYNHPSGDSKPWTDDRALTVRMVGTGEVMRICVFRHLVLTNQDYYCLLDAGRLPH
jgi:DNA repair protein RadC